MPIRSLDSAVLKWPARDAVLSAARQWARALCDRDETVEQVFCVGSYARGNWGVGSDLDVIVVIRDTELSALERHIRYEPVDVPVPCDTWVYTGREWDALASHSPNLWRRLQAEKLDLLGE